MKITFEKGNPEKGNPASGQPWETGRTETPLQEKGSQESGTRPWEKGASNEQQIKNEDNKDKPNSEPGEEMEELGKEEINRIEKSPKGKNSRAQK